MSLIGKAAGEGHFLDRQISLREQPLRTLHAPVDHEGVRRATEGFAEMPTERTDAHPDHRGEVIETDRFVQPRFDVLEEPADLAARKTPARDRIAKGDTGVAAQQLHRHALFAEQPMVLITRKDFPASNLQEFIAYVKENGAKLQYGSAGVGSTTHVGCALLNAAAGINITHIPYRGGGPAMVDLIAGHVDYMCAGNVSAVPQIASKTLKGIAILARNRSPLLPSLATAHEQGLTNFEAVAWNAFFMPRGTPAAIVKKLNDATIEAMNNPAVKDRMQELGVATVAAERRSPDYLQKFVESEIAKWEAVIEAAGINMD